MHILKHYPKYFLLMINCMPFIIVGSGIMLIAFSGISWLYLLGITLIIIGFKFPVVKINNYIINSLFYETIKNLDDSQWLALFIEKTETSHRLKLVPDDISLIYKQGDQIIYLDSAHREMILPMANLTFKNIANNDLFCSIQCHNDLNEREYNFLISPMYKGDDFYVSSSGSKRFDWFMEWIGCSTHEFSNNHSNEEILRHL